LKPDEDLTYVSPIDYLGANAKLLSRLISEGSIAGEEIFAYLAYSLRISQIAQSHSWRSTLFYDRRFRMIQASTGRSWSSEPAGLASACLEKRQPVGDKQAGGKPNGATSSDLCRQFNISNCLYNPCKFKHRCAVCNGEHSAAQHASFEKK